MNKPHWLAIFIIFTVLFAGIVQADNSGDFGFRVGLGYDFVSQEYFLDSLRYDTLNGTNPDSYVEATLLKKDYLDDKKGLIYFKFDRAKENRQVLEIGWEQTSEQYRAIGRGHLNIGNRRDIFDADINFELKAKYKGQITEGEDMSVFDGYARYRHKLSNFVESTLRLKAEKVAFDSVESLVYNYSKIGIETGLNFLTENFNSIYFLAGISKRNVPDSSRLNYLQLRLNLGYLGQFLGAQLTGDLNVENKKYNHSDINDDYTLTTFYSNLKFPISKYLYLKPQLNFEFSDFRSENYINFDNFLGRFGLILERNLNQFTVYFGPKIEFLTVQESDRTDDYFEIYAFSGLDFFQTGAILLLLENQIGKRNYQNYSDYYSDFIFDRASIIGNMKIYKGLTFDILFSAEWEWHDETDHDNRLYLLSSGLNYTF